MGSLRALYLRMIGSRRYPWLRRLFEGVELLHRVAESGVFFVDYVRMRHFEEFVGGDAVEPLLLRYFLVA